MATKIGIIGDGNVGSALARGLKRAGHDVRAVGNDKAAIRDTAGWAELVGLAGNDQPSEQNVMELARGIGFDPVDAGPLKNARLLEPLGYLDIQVGYALGMGTPIGFKLLHG